MLGGINAQRRSFRGLILICALIFAALTADRAQARPEDVPGYLMKQNSKRYGAISTLIGPKGFRMDAMGIKIYCTAPFQVISMYNAANKSVFRTAVTTFGQRVNLLTLTAKEKAQGLKIAVKSEPKSTFAGLTLQNTLMEHLDSKGKRKPVMRIASTHDIKLPRALEQACCILTSCPPGYGLPIKLYMWSGGLREPLLETTKLEKKDFAQSAFAEPRGYRQVSDEMQLMMEDDNLQAF
jgi:hypothetical protein